MKLRVITFNLRFENDRDGENSWDNRREMIVRLVKRWCPDILGTQEGKWNQINYLRQNLSGYRAHLPERPDDEKAQCPTLFVRGERLAVEGGRDFWLSKTPDIHLSKDWDSAFPRMISYAFLRPVESGAPVFCAAVTHLDHVGQKARLRQSEIIADWAAGLECPVLLMGDFNEEPDADVYRTLTGPAGPGLHDTWRVLGRPEGPESYTHHGFSGSPKGNRIDWILAGPGFSVLDVDIIKYRENGYYPSDHFPYMADLELGG